MAPLSGAPSCTQSQHMNADVNIVLTMQHRCRNPRARWETRSGGAVGNAGQGAQQPSTGEPSALESPTGRPSTSLSRRRHVACLVELHVAVEINQAIQFRVSFHAALSASLSALRARGSQVRGVEPACHPFCRRLTLSYRLSVRCLTETRGETIFEPIGLNG